MEWDEGFFTFVIVAVAIAMFAIGWQMFKHF